MLERCTGSPRQERIVIIIVVTIVASTSVVICVWISQVFATDGVMKKSEALQHELECAQCRINQRKEKEQNCGRCDPWKWPIGRSGRVSAKCLQDSFFRSKVDPHVKVRASRLGVEHDILARHGTTFVMIESQMQEQNHELNREMTKSQFRTLEQASRAHYQSPRLIMHWFPLRWRSEANSTWTAITDYERHRSTYTVSEGPNGSCDEHGHMVATEMGLYFVYAKLTFSCKLADLKIKHVAMEVSLIETSDYAPFIILKERQQARCRLAGDLVTLHQSGLIRMGKENKLKLRYHVSDIENVHISTGRNEAFKSCLGMYKVGLA